MSQSRTGLISGLICLYLSSFAGTLKSEEKNLTPVTTHCDLLSRGPNVELAQQEITLHSTLNEILDIFRQENFDSLPKYLHSSLKVKKQIGDQIKSILENRYDRPLQYSLFRAWRISTPGGKKSLLDQCPESDGAVIISQFGHDKQFAIWLQIMGQNELGRIILALAPEKSKLKIVGIRLQQWTQNGDDWERWAKRGEQFNLNKNLREAYFSFDIAQKLLTGEDFVIYPMQKILWEQRKNAMDTAQVLKELNQVTHTQSIVYVGSLMTKEGTGYLIREIVNPDQSSEKLHRLCEERAMDLVKSKWLQDRQGLRCNYIVAGWDPTRDSPLGGFYLSPSDLKNIQK